MKLRWVVSLDIFIFSFKVCSSKQQLIYNAWEIQHSANHHFLTFKIKKLLIWQLVNMISWFSRKKKHKIAKIPFLSAQFIIVLFWFLSCLIHRIFNLGVGFVLPFSFFIFFSLNFNVPTKSSPKGNVLLVTA